MTSIALLQSRDIMESMHLVTVNLMNQNNDTITSSRTIKLVNLYSILTLALVGLFFNCVSLAVLSNSLTIRNTTCGHYLISLSVADSGYLVGELMKSFTKYDPEGRYFIENNFSGTLSYCHVTFILRYAFKSISAWLTVVITVERFLVVKFPLKVALISTIKSARYIIFAISVVSLSLNLFPLWTIGLHYENEHQYCKLLKSDDYSVWNTAILRIYQLLLPNIIILIFTGLILLELTKINKNRCLQVRGQMITEKQRSVQKQLTRMLLSVAISSLILRTPYAVSYYVNKKHNEGLILDPTNKYSDYNIYLSRLYKTLEDLSEIIGVFNYVLNFFLYCFCGSAFRSSFYQLLTRCRETLDYGLRRKRPHQHQITNKETKRDEHTHLKTTILQD